MIIGRFAQLIPCLAVAALRLRAQSPTLDTAAAAKALAELDTACAADGAQTWGRSLCGPMILVDLRHSTVVANHADPQGRLRPWNNVFVGAWLDSIGVANTAIDWANMRWATARLPLPEDRFDRLTLLLHESFHREQKSLGLSSTDPANPQLDERDGRYWLRLELNALGKAVTASDDAPARQYARDAVLFRAERYRLFPGADTTERELEMQEGLAAFTGERLAVDAGAGDLAGVGSRLVDWQQTSSYPRSFAYATGPGLGFVLDRFDRQWRSRIRVRHALGALLRDAVGAPRGSIHDSAVAAAQRYGGLTIAVEEDARDSARRRRLVEYRARFVDGPMLILRQTDLARSFDPNNLAEFPGYGTVYPTGGFAARWGQLTVDSLGALVASDFSSIRVAAPADTAARPLTGPGWKLKLKPGWIVKPGARPGDFEVVSQARP